MAGPEVQNPQTAAASAPSPDRVLGMVFVRHLGSTTPSRLLPVAVEEAARIWACVRRAGSSPLPLPNELHGFKSPSLHSDDLVPCPSVYKQTTSAPLRSRPQPRYHSSSPHHGIEPLYLILLASPQSPNRGWLDRYIRRFETQDQASGWRMGGRLGQVSNAPSGRYCGIWPRRARRPLPAPLRCGLWGRAGGGERA